MSGFKRLGDDLSWWCIYVLFNPEDGVVRYVGWTRDVAMRMHAHLYSSGGRDSKTYRAKWVRSLRERGLRPFMEIVEVGSGGGWGEREQYWIAHYRSIGSPLANHGPGGEGNLGYRATEEQRKAMSISRTGRKMPPWTEERRIKTCAALKGRVIPEEQIRKHSQALKGRKLSGDALANVTAANKSIEKRMDASRKLSGRKMAPEVGAATRARLIGIPHSEETKQRMRDGKKRSHGRRLMCRRHVKNMMLIEKHWDDIFSSRFNEFLSLAA